MEVYCQLKLASFVHILVCIEQTGIQAFEVIEN